MLEAPTAQQSQKVAEMVGDTLTRYFEAVSFSALEEGAAGR